jgi:3-hydroxymyristoyl/3-hydroxydecanoyl-(acyl carrier protein) dehydratase
MMSEPSETDASFRDDVDVPPDHPCFAGHFPGHPILPGVLLLERVMALARASLTDPLTGCTLSNVKFLSAVSPGDALQLQLTRMKSKGWQFTVHVARPDAGTSLLACSGQLRLAQADEV